MGPDETRIMSQRITLPAEERTITGLLKAFERELRRPKKVEALFYRRGEGSFTVERPVSAEEAAVESLLSPWQQARQQCDIEILYPREGDTPLLQVALAVQTLSARGARATMFVARNKESLRGWWGQDLRPADIWQLPLYADSEMNNDGLLVLGSAQGAGIADVEYAILCSRS